MGRVGLTLVYGLLLGAMRQLTGGIRVPVLVHMAADAVIAIVFVTPRDFSRIRISFQT